MTVQESVFELPWDIIIAGKGLSFDIGGSVAKVIYLHKDDYIKASDRTEDTLGQIRMVSFAREELHRVLEHVREKVHIIREHESTMQIYTTGCGTTELQEKIRMELNLDNINITETDCFVQSFVYIMENLPRKKVLLDIDQQAYSRARKQVDQTYDMMMRFKDVSSCINDNGDFEKPELAHPKVYTEYPERPLAEEPGMFPMVLVMCGSGVSAMLVNRDCSFSMLDGSPRGGKAFHGLGSLLTGAKTFHELMDLAEKGNAFNVGLSNRHLQSGDAGGTAGQDDMYSLFADSGYIGDEMAFFFGQAVGKTSDQFKKEDLIRCLLQMTVQDLVYVAHYACAMANVKHVFFTGGFTSHPLIRHLISTEWLYREVNFAMYAEKPLGRTAFHFLRHGSYLGCLGSYLNSKLSFVLDSGKVKTAQRERQVEDKR